MLSIPTDTDYKLIYSVYLQCVCITDVINCSLGLGLLCVCECVFFGVYSSVEFY